MKRIIRMERMKRIKGIKRISSASIKQIQLNRDTVDEADGSRRNNKYNKCSDDNYTQLGRKQRQCQGLHTGCLSSRPSSSSWSTRQTSS